MHAVVVRVAIEDFDQARQALHNEVIPGVRSAPGFVTRYWLEPVDEEGMSVVVFETGPREMSKMLQPGTQTSRFATVESSEVREVVGHA